VLLLTVQNNNITKRKIYFTIYESSWDSAVGTVNRLWCGWPRNYASQFLARKGDFFCSGMSRMDLQYTQFLIHWVLGTLDKEVKWARYEADHSPPTSAEVKNECRSCISHPPYTFMVCKGVTLHFLSPRNPTLTL